MFVEVIKAYEAQYSDPISFVAGATLEVVKADPEFPGWHWCRTSTGKKGWVHRSCLSAIAGTTTGTRTYSARELTVTTGEKGALLESLDGWVCLRLQSGEEGWLPETHVRTIAP